MTEPVRLIDTSVLVRYVAGDNPEKQAQARRLIESDQPLGLTAVAVLESAYVLQRFYGYTRIDVVDALIQLVTRENFIGVGINPEQIAAKLALCRASGTVSFGDALLAATAASAGSDGAYTFDEKLWRAGLIAVVP